MSRCAESYHIQQDTRPRAAWVEGKNGRTLGFSLGRVVEQIAVSRLAESVEKNEPQKISEEKQVA